MAGYYLLETATTNKMTKRVIPLESKTEDVMTSELVNTKPPAVITTASGNTELTTASSPTTSDKVQSGIAVEPKVQNEGKLIN